MLTFVLPMKSSKDIYIGCTILLPSLFNFYIDDFKLIIIISKDEQNVYNKYKYNSNNIIILFEEYIYNLKANNTYYYQMLLKLYIVKYINTAFYICLDSDNIFCKKCNIENFIKKDYCYYQKIKKIDEWGKRVEKSLNITLDFVTNQTPFVFNKKCVINMINNIDINDLILKKKCSEYTLYLGYLIKNNIWDNHYINHIFTAEPITQNTINLNRDIEIILNESFLLNDNKVITCIQSRLNIIDQYISLLKIYIPTITYNKLNIGILTVCSNDNYFKKYEEPLFIKRDYCKYHNYNFIIKLFNKCNGWEKILVLKEELKKYDYIFMSDTDVIITNRDIRIEDIIYKYYKKNKFMYISCDYNSINSGNIIWKNCDESFEFLDKVIELGKNNIRFSLNIPYNVIGIYEQPSIIYWINKEYNNNIIIIPQYEINSYIIDKKNINNERGLWKNGDFLIHFAGLNNNNININNLINKFCYIYKINIIKKEGSDYGNIK
jgi:hypothetical protein